MTIFLSIVLGILGALLGCGIHILTAASSYGPTFEPFSRKATKSFFMKVRDFAWHERRELLILWGTVGVALSFVVWGLIHFLTP